MGDSPLGKIELAATSFYVSDLDAAIAWYGDKFGLQPVTVGADGHGYASFLMGGAIVVLEPIEAALEPSELGRDNTTVNLVVSRDPSEVRDHLTARGVTCGPLVASPNFVSYLVRDRDGNRFYVTRPMSKEAIEAVDGLALDDVES
jgi:catechol 2,3-dioxygenase-like lactoylglutathione lyase family enzyme